MELLLERQPVCNASTIVIEKTNSYKIQLGNSDTHEEICIRALEADKHVLCEKPLATTLKSSIHVINLAKKRNKILLVAFNR